MAEGRALMTQGLVFLGILVVAGLLLADGKLVRFWRPKTGIWVFKPGRRRQRQHADVFLMILFCVLCGWLIQDRGHAGQKSLGEHGRLEKHAILLQAR